MFTVAPPYFGLRFYFFQMFSVDSLRQSDPYLVWGFGSHHLLVFAWLSIIGFVNPREPKIARPGLHSRDFGRKVQRYVSRIFWRPTDVLRLAENCWKCAKQYAPAARDGEYESSSFEALSSSWYRVWFYSPEFAYCTILRLGTNGALLRNSRVPFASRPGK